MRRATIEIGCHETALLKESLAPETERSIPRTSVNVMDMGDVLRIEIEASDVNALRAAINSYLRWVSVGLGSAALTSER